MLVKFTVTFLKELLQELCEGSQRLHLRMFNYNLPVSPRENFLKSFEVSTWQKKVTSFECESCKMSLIVFLCESAIFAKLREIRAKKGKYLRLWF